MKTQHNISQYFIVTTWSIIFNSCESLCCTLETYSTVNQLYVYLKNKTSEGKKKRNLKICVQTAGKSTLFLNFHSISLQLYNIYTQKPYHAKLLLWPYGLQSVRLLCPCDSAGKNSGVGCHSLLQGIFLTQRSNPGLLRVLHWQAGSFKFN